MELSSKEHIAQYEASFLIHEKNLNGEANSWLHDIRKRALAKFSELGFPTTRHEEWKYTNIGAIARAKFNTVHRHEISPIPEAVLERYSYDDMRSHLLVFVDGHYSEKLSKIGDLPDRVRICSMAEAVKSNPEIAEKHLARYATFDQDAFTALNTAFIHDGAFIHLRDNATVDVPIHLLFLSSGRLEPFITFPRNLIVAGKNSVATIIETFAGADTNEYCTNTVTEVVLDTDSVLDHYRIQEESESAYHISTLRVHHLGKSAFSSHSAMFGGAITRNNSYAVLDAQGVETTLNGLYLGTGRQVIDNHTTIDHAQPHCNSHEVYKGILDGQAHGVFNGKIFVRVDAQKTDAKQTNKALLLSDEAAIDTKPQLEIFADDVKCTHGATIGQLDNNALFYLRSRGIDKELSRDILTYAFASDVIDRIKVKELRDYLHHRVLVKLLQDRLKGIYEGS